MIISFHLSIKGDAARPQQVEDPDVESHHPSMQSLIQRRAKPEKIRHVSCIIYVRLSLRSVHVVEILYMKTACWWLELHGLLEEKARALNMHQLVS